MQDITCWKGKDITTMSREELIVALRDAARLYLKLIESNIKQRQYRRRK